MMKLLSESKERNWYLVKDFVTKAGLRAQICQCVWSNEVKAIVKSLHDHYTGYVQVPENDTNTYYDTDKVDAHGGITFENTREDESGRWVGFDLAHLGDEKIEDPLEYAEEECEHIAEQIKEINAL